MTNSRSHKEEAGDNNEASKDDFMESTSARTRPFSLDEIMRRRKNKADAAKNNENASGLPDIASAKGNIEKAHSPKSHRKRNEDSATMGAKYTSNDPQKASSTRKKDIKVSSKNDKLVQDKDKGYRHDAKSKGTMEPNVSNNKVTGGKHERRHHSEKNNSDNVSNMRGERDFIQKDKVSETGKGKSDMDRKQLDDNTHGHRKRKTEKNRSNDTENESKKRNIKDVMSIEKTSAKGGEKYEKDNKHKCHNEEDKSIGRSNGKKHDSEKRLDSTRTNHEESRPKRRRSRSKEHDRNRSGRSPAPHSAKLHKDTSDKSVHGTLSSHSTKDRSGREHSEVDKKRIPSDGSNSHYRRSKEHARDRSRSRSHSPKLHKETFKDKSELGELSMDFTKDRPGKENTEVDKKRISSNGFNSHYRRKKDHERDRSRRSRSHSPKLHKETFKDKSELGEQSAEFTKDRPGRENTEVDKKRIPSNGSNHYRRNTVSSSGLGGYSPRKRKTDAAARTPSPIRRSPEKTSVSDLQPVGKESIISGSTPSKSHSSGQKLLSNVKEVPIEAPVVPNIVKSAGISHHTLSSQMHAIEPVQLTQATRPMRRLYVENLPASASEKDFMECVNKFLLSYGFNYIQGSQPCISCMIHKEKGQALLEFLTPEDASAALSFDGLFFSGSYLKFRRPKDYAEVTTGLLDKSVAAIDSIIGHVEDSSHKIFIGGISKVITSKMLLEIVRAFGPVKAYHFQYNADNNERCAFLEFADHSVTSKACAGLNGMRLGGNFLTAVCASVDPVLVGNVGKPPFYGIPEHAKPLLEKPTPVLRLKNVLDPEGVLSLSESELEEILEDIKLECSRFGMVKSVNIAKSTHALSNLCAYEAINGTDPFNNCNIEFDNKVDIIEQSDHSMNVLGEFSRLQPQETLDISENNSQTAEDTKRCDGNAENVTTDTICEPPLDDTNVPTKEELSDSSDLEMVNRQITSAGKLENNDNSAQSISMKIESMAPLIEEELNVDENNSETERSPGLDNNERKELDILKEDGIGTDDNSTDSGSVFEPGSVFVEYKRAEAACIAAHCLHGRIFDGQVVTVEYVDNDLYQMKFRK